MYKLEKRLRSVQMRWDFHLENVRTETRTRHISSVISLYTFQCRIVMMIMRRILVLVDESIRTWLSVTVVVNLCQSGQK